jgi:hypothetical protein
MTPADAGGQVINLAFLDFLVAEKRIRIGPFARLLESIRWSMKIDDEKARRD